jgi:hypothetical protein
MLLYSILVPIISIIAIVWFLLRYLKEKSSLITTILWTIFWVIVSLFAVFPNYSNAFARLFGVTRGLDFIIIIVFAVLVYTIFILYNKIDKLQDDVNKIVKEVALSNEITLDEKEE